MKRPEPDIKKILDDLEIGESDAKAVLLIEDVHKVLREGGLNPLNQIGILEVVKAEVMRRVFLQSDALREEIEGNQ